VCVCVCVCAKEERASDELIYRKSFCFCFPNANQRNVASAPPHIINYNNIIIIHLCACRYKQLPVVFGKTIFRSRFDDKSFTHDKRSRNNITMYRILWTARRHGRAETLARAGGARLCTKYY